MNRRWIVVRWALLSSAVASGLAVSVNLATELKTSWIAWVGVVLFTVVVGVLNVVVQHFSAGRDSVTRQDSPGQEDDPASVSPGPRSEGINTEISGPVHGSININHINQVGRRVTIIEVTALAFAAVAMTLALHVSNRQAGGANTYPPPATTAPERDSPSEPLIVYETWPLSRGCDGGTSIAMPAGGPDIGSFTLDGFERQRMINAGGGSWRAGSLYLDFSTRAGTSVRILNLRPLIDPERPPATDWVYSPGGGCGGPTGRRFSLSLDRPSLIDAGVPEGDLGEEGPDVRTEPIGPTFTVTDDTPATLRFDVRGCKANYQWRIEVTYAVAGEPSTRTYTTKPYRTLGVARSAPIYSRSESNSYTGVAMTTPDDARDCQ